MMKQFLRPQKAMVSIAVALVLAVSIFGSAPAPAVRAQTLCVNVGGTDGCYATIQAAIDAAAVGDTIDIQAGVYIENVIVNKPLTLTGAGATANGTVLVPALNSPTCASGGGTLCAGHSTLILVQANDVHIEHMLLDGDNTALAGGFAQGGADVNARNGIVQSSGVKYNNMEVNNVLVKNIYLRGIYNTSSGVGFNIHDNIVQNVQGESQSIAIMSWGGKGVIQDNVLDNVNDAITANWSEGIQFLNNTITNAGSGIHTDNAGTTAVSTADLIQGNHVSSCKTNGYGIFVFAASKPHVVDSNVVEDCAVGLAHFGSRNSTLVTFTNNELDGTGTTGGAGIYITTSVVGYGSDNVAANVRNNLVENFADALYIEGQAGFTNTVTIENNAVNGAVNGLVKDGTGTINLTAARNWWGSPTGPTVAENPGGAGAVIPTGVPFTPWLCADTDTSTDRGFQPGTSLCGLAEKLVFSVQPGGAGLSAPLVPQPVVRAVDADGNLAINFTGEVTVALDTNPATASLAGTKTVNAVGGVATFTGLAVDQEAEGYTLKATSTGLDEVISAAFDIANLIFYLPVIGK